MPASDPQTTDSSAHLLWPGLFEPPDDGQPVPPDAAEFLCDCLSRADRIAPSDTVLPGQTGAVGEPPAMADFAYLADFGQLPGELCWCCNPVHLRSDLSQAFLLDSIHFPVAPEESAQLVAAFNDHFSERGLKLEHNHLRRWYLFGLPYREPVPVPVGRLDGRSVEAFLPGRSDLAALLNETQMLFHAHPVNRQREAEGRLLLNGIWVYGAGRRPPRDAVPWNAVYSESVFYKGLARYGELPYDDGAGGPDIDAIAGRGAVLIHTDALTAASVEGTHAWLNELAMLEARWLAPLIAAIRAGRIRSLVIDPGEGPRYRLDRSRLRRFWRRRKPLAHWMRPAA